MGKAFGGRAGPTNVRKPDEDLMLAVGRRSIRLRDCQVLAETCDSDSGTYTCLLDAALGSPVWMVSGPDSPTSSARSGSRWWTVSVQVTAEQARELSESWAPAALERKP